MSGPDWNQQQELESERYLRAVEILLKARRAHKDGYFTNEDIQDMQREFGLSTHKHLTQPET
jgi:hypothetical protein